MLAPLRYFETKPNDALPTSAGSAGKAPTGLLIHPPPVTKPPAGSYTTTYSKMLSLDVPPSSSDTFMRTTSAPGVEYVWEPAAAPLLTEPAVTDPSPQSIAALWVSSTPASAYWPAMLTALPTTTGPEGPAREPSRGATFATVT